MDTTTIIAIVATFLAIVGVVIAVVMNIGVPNGTSVEITTPPPTEPPLAPIDKTSQWHNKKIHLIYDFDTNKCLYTFRNSFTTPANNCRDESFFQFLAYKKNSSDTSLVLASTDKSYFFNVNGSAIVFENEHDGTKWKFLQDAYDPSLYYIQLDGSNKYLNYVTTGSMLVPERVQVRDTRQAFKLSF